MTLETITLITTALETLSVGTLALIFLTLTQKWCDPFYAKSLGVYLVFDAFGNAVEFSERLGAYTPSNPAVDDLVVGGAAAAIALLVTLYTFRIKE